MCDSVPGFQHDGPVPELPTLLPLLERFGADLTTAYDAAAATSAQAEDQLKSPTKWLLEAAATVFGLTAVATTESHTDLGVRPDIGVSDPKLLIGHVELKAPGIGARARNFAGKHDREQFKKLADHPNLVYTDGNEWALYRKGSVVGTVVTASGDVRVDGADTYSARESLVLEQLLRDFFGWEPIVPRSPKALAELLAPLTRLLRENVRTALTDPHSALSSLAKEWRDVFFPDADDARFADAYAQTVTYALLLARFEGELELKDHAADRLDARHGLLAQVLRVLEQAEARKEVESAVGLLERAIAAVDPDAFAMKAKSKDIWLYFYEDFLAVYDPQQRRRAGVYYTPAEVVRAQVSLVGELLRKRFGKSLGFADEGVTVLDPGVGTGTYLLAALQHGLEAAVSTYGPGHLAAAATVMARNFHAFERQVGPYAVAHLRVARDVFAAGGHLPPEGVQVYLTDTLESPHAAPPGSAHVPLFERKLADENARARKVKAELPVLVCLGNPPYFRETIDPGEEGVERQGKWIKKGDDDEGGILDDFLRGTPGVHAKSLYNLYVYFWRWALWKVFESPPGTGRGIVSFITASSYLRGPGFAGMRRHMRETFDELWILDLGGEGRGARRSENVFAIQTPVAIAVGVRSRPADASAPATVRYSRVDGPRSAKLAELAAIQGFGSVRWQECYDGWEQPFLPAGEGDYFSWPPLTDLFPWQHSGVQFKRTWPIAPSRETLERRWAELVAAPFERRKQLFRETRDRKIGGSYESLAAGMLEQIDTVSPGAPPPAPIRYAYRSFDRQYCLPDSRLGDFLRPVLWRVTSARQLFLTSHIGDVLGSGPGSIVTDSPPDMHHFSGRGGKDVIPLWRDAEAQKPNVTEGVVESLGAGSPEDIFAYCYALLTAPDYTARFSDELEVPGSRIPLTRDRKLVERAVVLGRELIWLHTFGERFPPPGQAAGIVPKGRAEARKPVPQPPNYPERHWYDEETETLHVGDGTFAPVSKAVREFSVSGLDVIGSWLDYRMKDGAGRRSSDLDRIRPTTWPAEFTEELLKVIWILERTVELGPQLDALLDEIVAGPIFLASDLPEPTEAERQPPD